MKTLITKSIFIFLFTLSAFSCSDEKKVSNERSETLTIQTDDTKWTYLSLETGKVVGTSPIDNPSTDQEWSRRTDWDIAICKGMIRTNSGTSGCGNGGIQTTDQTFEQIHEAPQSGYETDTEKIEVW